MIFSSDGGRPPLTYANWASKANVYLIDRGYPPHTALNRIQVQEGLTVTGLPDWALSGSTPTAPIQPTTIDVGATLYSKKPSLKPKSLNKIYNIPFYDAFKNRLGPKAKGEIGLEIEAEGMNLFNLPISYWVCKPDGSLRTYKDHPPVEYVLREPIHRNDVPKALAYLTKKLKETGSSIIESHRTSVHVHVNCQELTVKQIYQYWCLYTIFEEMLVDFSGPDRPGNLFCLSSKQAEYAVTCLESAIQTENFNEVFNDNLRYTSCNMASLGKFGSMEFRSMRGTVDQDLIQAWVDIILILRDKALEYDCPRSIVEDYTRLGPDAFLTKVFGSRPELRAIFASRPLAERNKSMWEGLRLMKDVAYAIKWDKQIPEEKKKDPENPVKYSYDGYWDYQPVQHIQDQVWLLYSEENDHHRVVNFGTNTVICPLGNYPECHFTPRRFWAYDPEQEIFIHNSSGDAGAISVEHYAPEI